MTNAELITKIKSEIERRIKIQDDWAGRKVLPGRDLAFAVKEELKQLLSFLDTLESETPMNLEGLEEEIDRIVKCEKEFMNFKYKSQLIGYIARHFAQWGAEHLKK